MTLAGLQRSFADHLHDRPSKIAWALADARGLAVYHHAYRATLAGALRETYTRTALWIGTEAFDRMADTYIAAAPSRSWTLDDYGLDFPDHLASLLPDEPEVSELAWLEGEMRRAFAAADAGPVERMSLAAVDWEQATIRLAPTVATCTIVGDIPGIWHALGEDRVPIRARLDEPAGLIVWRVGFEPCFRSSTSAESEALGAVSEGVPFAAMCVAAAIAGASELDVGGWLSRWLDDGLIIDVLSTPAAGRA